MKRESVVTLSRVEERALGQLAQRSRELAIARKAREDLIHVCLDLKLPVRLIGEYAGLSGAAISRMNGARK